MRFVERENDDFAECVARLLIFATWRLALLQRLVASVDPVLAAIAAKGVKELTYHRDYAAQWVVRLGDGTAESHRRMDAALSTLWPLVGELFAATEVEGELAEAGAAIDPAELRGDVDAVIATVTAAATVELPEGNEPVAPTGREGVHTAALGRLLVELQELARAEPEAVW